MYNWKARFGGMDVSHAPRLKAVEEENGKPFDASREITSYIVAFPHLTLESSSPIIALRDTCTMFCPSALDLHVESPDSDVGRDGAATPAIRRQSTARFLGQGGIVWQSGTCSFG